MKSKLLGITVFVAGIAGAGLAGTIPSPYIAGDFQGWAPGVTAMTETSPGSDIWTYTVTGLTADTYHGFKITDDTGTWNGPTVPAANSWFYSDGSGSDITITYDGNTYADGWSPSSDRISLSYNTVTTWEATGDFLTEIGGVSDWLNNSGLAPMTDQGGGIYSVTITNITAGSYQIKAVESGTWHAIGSDGRSEDAANFSFTTTVTDNDVVFTIDAVNNLAKVQVIPEPATLGLLGMAGVGLLIARRRFLI